MFITNCRKCTRRIFVYVCPPHSGSFKYINKHTTEKYWVYNGLETNIEEQFMTFMTTKKK